MHNYNERFVNTYAALDVWHAGQELAQQQWSDCETDDDVNACERNDEARAIPVRLALYEDTKDVNSKSHVEYLSIASIIKLSKYESRVIKFEIDLSFLAGQPTR